MTITMDGPFEGKCLRERKDTTSSPRDRRRKAMDKRNDFSKSFLLISLALMLGSGAASAQRVTSASVSNVPNNGAGNEPFAGGGRVAHVINMGTGKAIRDFHVCVGQTKIKNRERAVVGDPINNNYRETPGTTPPNWAYRGVQAGNTVNKGGVSVTDWCVTWVKTTDGGAPDNATITFQFDYRGKNKLKSQKAKAVFTNDGDNNVDTGGVGMGSAVAPMAAKSGEEFPGGLAGAFFIAVIIGTMLAWILQMFLRRIRRRGVDEITRGSR